jgi:Na+/proline symporter
LYEHFFSYNCVSFSSKDGRFLASTSVAEAMGNLYGIEVRLITAVCGILGTIGIIAVQFKVFGNVFNYFLGIDSIYALLLASTIVILYSTFGGIRAVTHTDVVQFCTFGFVIPLIGVIIYNHITSENNFSFNDVIRTANFNYKEVFNLGNPKFWEMIPLILYFALPSMDPTGFQRVSMGKSIG